MLSCSIAGYEAFVVAVPQNQISEIVDTTQSCLGRNEGPEILTIYRNLNSFCCRYQIYILTAQAKLLHTSRWKNWLTINTSSDTSLKLAIWDQSKHFQITIEISKAEDYRSEWANLSEISQEHVLAASLDELLVPQTASSLSIDIQITEKSKESQKMSFEDLTLTPSCLDVEAILLAVAKKATGLILANIHDSLSELEIKYSTHLNDSNVEFVPSVELNYLESDWIKLCVHPRKGNITAHDLNISEISAETGSSLIVLQVQKMLDAGDDIGKIISYLKPAKMLDRISSICLYLGLDAVTDSSRFVSDGGISVRVFSIPGTDASISIRATDECTFIVGIWLLNSISDALEFEILRPVDISDTTPVNSDEWPELGLKRISLILEYCNKMYLISQLSRALLKVEANFDFLVNKVFQKSGRKLTELQIFGMSPAILVYSSSLGRVNCDLVGDVILKVCRTRSGGECSITTSVRLQQPLFDLVQRIFHDKAMVSSRATVIADGQLLVHEYTHFAVFESCFYSDNYCFMNIAAIYASGILNDLTQR